jgi:hypothetical protein
MTDEPRACLVCGRDMTGYRADARVCSAQCRVTRARRSKRGATATGEAVTPSATATGEAVTPSATASGCIHGDAWLARAEQLIARHGMTDESARVRRAGMPVVPIELAPTVTAASYLAVDPQGNPGGHRYLAGSMGRRVCKAHGWQGTGDCPH